MTTDQSLPLREIPKKRRFIEIAVAFVAASCALVGSFFNFINYNQYYLWTSEVAICVTILILMALLLTIVYAISNRTIRIVIAALLVFFVADINFDGTIVYLVTAGAVVLLGRLVMPGLAIVFGFIVLSEIAISIAFVDPIDERDSVSLTPNVGTSLGPTDDLAIVHIILDEHIGLEGLPASIQGGMELRQTLHDFYIDHGFAVFGGAYSESLHTINAIPRVIEMGLRDEWPHYNKENIAIAENSYFDRLSSMGFRISVYQSDWIDYCEHAAVEHCLTYPAGRPVNVGSQLTATDRAAILFYEFWPLSNLAVAIANSYDHAALALRKTIALPFIEIESNVGASTLNGMKLLERVIVDARDLEPGTAMFAHILAPHYPYAYDADCQIRPVSEWLGRHSPRPRNERYQRYFSQVQCVTERIDALLTAIAASPAGSQTVIIIHGDHGSRITTVDPKVETWGRYTDRDLIDGYSTLFVIASPFINPDYNSMHYPISALLSRFVESGFHTAVPELPDTFVPKVMIEDYQWNPQKSVDLPSYSWSHDPPSS